MSKNLIALQNKFLGRGETIYDRLANMRDEGRPLDDAALAELAAETGLPKAHVRSVAKFYDELRRGEAASLELRICNGEACQVADAGLRARLEEALGIDPLTGKSADGRLSLGQVTCLGYCSQGPNALSVSEGKMQVFSLAPEGREEELVRGLEEGKAPAFEEPRNAFYRSEDPGGRFLLERFGKGAEVLAKAKELGAYGALAKALERGIQAGGQWVLDEIQASEIRGRGGAGFPAGLKLKTVKEAPCRGGTRYVVCNADEGDAGAYIDKELMEQDPHAVLEGMLLAALAVGASEGFLYLRKEYPRARRRMGRAVDEARAGGYLGGNILGSGFSFDLRIVDGQGAYICGEETSLLRSLEGVPAQVSPKPPFPAVEGYKGAPTLVQNVETLAAFPGIVERGGATFAALGHGRSRGTKLVSLNSAVARPGLYEVELGLSLRELIFDRAGGMAEGRTFQAVQVGGPLGGIFPESLLDTKLDFEDFAAHRGLLGHAGVVVYPEGVDLVRVGRNLMAFCAVESCGKCFPCRIGSLRGTELFDRILGGRGSQADLDLLAELDETMLYGSLCALGGAIPTPIDNLMIHFIESFRKYIPDAKTPERVFRHLEA